MLLSRNNNNEEEVACASSVFDSQCIRSAKTKGKTKKRGRPAKTPVLAGVFAVGKMLADASAPTDARPDSEEDDSDASSTCSDDFDVIKCCENVRFAKYWNFFGKIIFYTCIFCRYR